MEINRHFHMTGAPEPPKNLNAVNESTESITLVWTPGFDGGADQNFRIRFKKSGTSIYFYREAPTNTTSYTITGLESGAKYDFFIAAYNFIGESAFTENVLTVSTKQIVIGMANYVNTGYNTKKLYSKTRCRSPPNRNVMARCVSLRLYDVYHFGPM